MKTTPVLSLVALLAFTGCKSEQKLDWSSYAVDYARLLSVTEYQETLPFRVSGQSIADSGKYLLGLTFDQAVRSLTEVRIMVMPFVNEIEFDPDTKTPIVPFLGYDYNSITLAPVQDNKNNIYAGLNIGFNGTVANPKVKISFRSMENTYFIEFQDFVFEEA